MDFERILQMTTSERNLALLQDEAFVDDVTEFLAIRQLYNAAIKQVRTKLEILNDGFQVEHCHNPIHHIECRLKSPGSMLEKLRRKGYPIEMQSLREGILDIAGVRVVCNYLNDVNLVADLLLSQDDIRLLKKKDFISNPKPNGYTSYHMIVSIPIFLSNDKIDTKVEIQIRTIAMDFWASLEHKIYYKFDGKAPDGIREELKECANIISFLDQKMFSINEDVKHYHDDFNGGSFVTNDLPAHITKENSDTIPPELKSLYGSVVSD